MDRRKDGRARGICVSGTDTEVGKTYVTCLLGRRLRAEGTIIRPFKPVESGCAADATGQLVPADATALRDATAPGLSIEDVCLYRLSAPLSPHLAARLEGVEIDPDRIRRAIQAGEQGADLVIVEGAGGITVELREGCSFAHLAKDLGYPALLIAENRLGILNEVALNMYYLAGMGIPLLGVILNDRTTDISSAMETNAAELKRICGPSYLGRFGYSAPAIPDDVYRYFLGRVSSST
jgi:dethiobiotin synthetase